MNGYSIESRLGGLTFASLTIFRLSLKRNLCAKSVSHRSKVKKSWVGWSGTITNRLCFAHARINTGNVSAVCIISFQNKESMYSKMVSTGGRKEVRQ